VPGLLPHHHLHEDVPGERGLGTNAALAILTHIGDRFGRDQNLAELVFHVVLANPLLQRHFHLVLIGRVGGDDIPLLGRHLLLTRVPLSSGTGRTSAGRIGCFFSHAPYTNMVTNPQSRSNRPIYTVANTPAAITTMVPFVTVSLFGQVTLESSSATSSAQRRRPSFRKQTMIRATPR